ncbi:MAG: LCP family protein [Candidatus Portnoybacteria bacterium]
MTRIKTFWVFILLLIVGVFSLFFFKTGFTVSQVIGWQDGINVLPSIKKMPDLPKDDPDRINLLLLGIRGLEDPGEGKLLSDAIILVSIENGRAALISLPRDIYTTIYCTGEDKKINFAYAQGGLDCAKKTVSLVSGQHIDYAVSANFEALKEAVDVIGGIDIYLTEPFEENFQWAKEGWEENENWFVKDFDGEERWVFHVPAGENHLDGKTALYYVRSRYSTNDFDRMRRQQQALTAIKDKSLSSGVLLNPVRIYNLLDVIGENIRTDMSLSEIKNLLGLASNMDVKNIKKKVFDTSEEGLLYQTFVNEEYVLLPVGDGFSQIQEACLNIFD